MPDALAPTQAAALTALHEAAARAADAGLSVAFVAVGTGPDQLFQFIDAGEERVKLLGALDVVRADILDDTPRDESAA